MRPVVPFLLPTLLLAVPPDQARTVALLRDARGHLANRAVQMGLDQHLLVDAVRQRIKEPPAQLIDSLLDQLRAFADEGFFSDDVCLVGMEFCGGGTP